jgi:hypothetical protein
LTYCPRNLPTPSIARPSKINPTYHLATLAWTRQYLQRWALLRCLNWKSMDQIRTGLPDEFVKLIAQNVAQPIFSLNLYTHFTVKHSGPKSWWVLYFLKKMQSI